MRQCQSAGGLQESANAKPHSICLIQPSHRRCRTRTRPCSSHLSHGCPRCRSPSIRHSLIHSFRQLYRVRWNHVSYHFTFNWILHAVAAYLLPFPILLPCPTTDVHPSVPFSYPQHSFPFTDPLLFFHFGFTHSLAREPIDRLDWKVRRFFCCAHRWSSRRSGERFRGSFR